MNRNDPWKRLTGLARPRGETPLASPAGMPFGFETRVLARLRVPRNGVTETWARWAMRAVPLGAAALLVCWMVLPALPAADPPATDEIEQLMQEVLNP